MKPWLGLGALAHLVVIAGRQPRAGVMDILIAATAHARKVALYTHDREDFDVFQDDIEIRRV